MPLFARAIDGVRTDPSEEFCPQKTRSQAKRNNENNGEGVGANGLNLPSTAIAMKKCINATFSLEL
jgi:hypothetical protein